MNTERRIVVPPKGLDFDRITEGVRELIPSRYRERVTRYAREVDLALTQFIRGQLTVMGIMAVLYGAAYFQS